jgi:hypothetical protein
VTVSQLGETRGSWSQSSPSQFCRSIGGRSGQSFLFYSNRVTFLLQPQLSVVDQSTHGTQWNDLEAQPEKEERQVAVGDRFAIGEYRFVVCGGLSGDGGGPVKDKVSRSSHVDEAFSHL